MLVPLIYQSKWRKYPKWKAYLSIIRKIIKNTLNSLNIVTAFREKLIKESPRCKIDNRRLRMKSNKHHNLPNQVRVIIKRTRWLPRGLIARRHFKVVPSQVIVHQPRRSTWQGYSQICSNFQEILNLVFKMRKKVQEGNLQEQMLVAEICMAN